MQFRSYRYPCDHPVRGVIAGIAQVARLVNISAEGARLTGFTGLAPGDRLPLELGPGCPPCQAEVRWVRGLHLGVRFDRPLIARSLALIRKTSGHRLGPMARVDPWATRELR